MCPEMASLQRWPNPPSAFTKSSVFKCGHLPFLAPVFIFPYFATYQSSMQANLTIQRWVLNLVCWCPQLDHPPLFPIGTKWGKAAMKAHALYGHCHPQFYPFLDNKHSDSTEPNFQINAVLITKPEKNTRQYQPAWKNLERICISYVSHRPKSDSTYSLMEIHTKHTTRC